MAAFSTMKQDRNRKVRGGIMILKKKVLALAIVTMVLSATSILITRLAFAAANTNGLKSISLQGVGVGALAAGECTSPPITCAPAHTCECLTGAQTVIGGLGFNKGSLTFELSIDETAILPVATVGDCLPATGFGTIASKNGKKTLSIDVSGLVCPTPEGAGQVFNGTYNVTGGTSFTSGTGAINGSQVGAVSRASLNGNVQ
jgi:hypothetical protein